MPRLGPDDVACWLLKTTRPPHVIDPGWTPGGVRELTRCVRASYRLGLMTAGAPCLLWLSGRADPGVHAIGAVLGAPRPGPDGPLVDVRLRLLAEPVPRGALLADARARTAEVLRMPAGSNPSWLSDPEFAAVHDLLEAPGA
ncbi:hypothetical protein GB931_14100 [Modestobacter sp. I12A-02628]|uniref:EVE domain-containing protein n=1 Tax=Goekera deserti TaxID=2497753 RepID=A0A7K3WHL3_9ACTN|nr:hypothetical protein [Goekera deserti]MPQ99033.1 hypothetical protein [Goekera deserti]NDI47367.1 hypothetical protein [Goekera deserti]NEL55897.1 hypothetical protein [Goekera deserti]